MRGTFVHIFTIGIAAALIANTQIAYAKSPELFVVTVRPRMPVQAGRVTWYEVTIKNAMDSDQIVDLGLVMVTDVTFSTPNDTKGLGQSTSDVNIAPPKCADWTAFAVVKPGASVTTLVKIETPWQVQGVVQLGLGFDLWRVVDLTNCRKELVEVTAKLEIQVRAA